MRRWLSVVLLLAPACREAPALPIEPLRDLAARCEALVNAAPHEWPEHLPALYAAGSACEGPLLDVLQRQPTAPGAQAAVGLLGRVGGAGARAFCEEQLRERTPLACEAALALGELPAGAEQTLRACVRDRLRGSDVRTAAACALARHGDREVAPEFLRAVVRAGTRAGREDERTLGMPQQPRWALERYFVQRTLLQLGHEDLAAELDPDAPWPRLEELAPRVAERLGR